MTLIVLTCVECGLAAYFDDSPAHPKRPPLCWSCSLGPDSETIRPRWGYPVHRQQDKPKGNRR